MGRAFPDSASRRSLHRLFPAASTFAPQRTQPGLLPAMALLAGAAPRRTLPAARFPSPKPRRIVSGAQGAERGEAGKFAAYRGLDHSVCPISYAFFAREMGI